MIAKAPNIGQEEQVHLSVAWFFLFKLLFSGCSCMPRVLFSGPSSFLLRHGIIKVGKDV